MQAILSEKMLLESITTHCSHIPICKASATRMSTVGRNFNEYTHLRTILIQPGEEGSEECVMAYSQEKGNVASINNTDSIIFTAPATPFGSSPIRRSSVGDSQL